MRRRRLAKVKLMAQSNGWIVRAAAVAVTVAAAPTKNKSSISGSHHLYRPVQRRLAVGACRVDLSCVQLGQQQVQVEHLVPGRELVQRCEAVGVGPARVHTRVLQLSGDLRLVPGEVWREKCAGEEREQ